MKNIEAQAKRSTLAWAASVFLACLLIYSLTSYGGIRSPDSEVVFRAAESFADHGRLDVPQRLEDWDGFGVARARDGRDYPIFGPAQSLALAPFVTLGRAAIRGWTPGSPVPPSLSVPSGFSNAMYGEPLEHWPAHALRLFCAWFNVKVAALCVAVYFLLLLRLTGSSAGAFLGASFLAVGSLFWPYAGTFFSEPLATLFLLLSFYWLAGTQASDRERSSGASARLVAALAGGALGCAVATHISAFLELPFFLGLAIWTLTRRARPAARGLLVAYAAGLAFVLAMLGVYNWSRFGNPLETGRGVDPHAVELFHYGVFTSPWRGLYGLTISPGKGLLLFSPAVVLALFAWRGFHRRFPALSWTIGGAATTRLLFIAARSDWHGGFCLGPRYLVTMLPFLLLPLGVLAGDAWRRADRRTLAMLAVALLICAAQQAAFSVGEIFTWLHRARFAGQNAGIDVFTDDHLYLDWTWSPLLHPMDGRLGPFLLGRLGWSKAGEWLALVSLVTASLLLGMRALARPRDTR